MNIGWFDSCLEAEQKASEVNTETDTIPDVGLTWPKGKGIVVWHWGNLSLTGDEC